MRRYHIQNREDYQSYNRLCGSVRGLAHKLSQLPPQDPFRTKYEGMLLSKLYDMGILDITSKVSDIEGKVTVSALCRRRLAVVMCRLKMCETVSKVGSLLIHRTKPLLTYLFRLSSISNKVTFVLGQIQLQIQLSWSLATWRTSLHGSIQASSSALSCNTTTSWTTSI